MAYGDISLYQVGSVSEKLYAGNIGQADSAAIYGDIAAICRRSASEKLYAGSIGQVPAYAYDPMRVLRLPLRDVRYWHVSAYAGAAMGLAMLVQVLEICPGELRYLPTLLLHQVRMLIGFACTEVPYGAGTAIGHARTEIAYAGRTAIG
eukprot:270938-Rhodomonas_salina.4